MHIYQLYSTARRLCGTALPIVFEFLKIHNDIYVTTTEMSCPDCVFLLYLIQGITVHLITIPLQVLLTQNRSTLLKRSLVLQWTPDMGGGCGLKDR